MKEFFKYTALNVLGMIGLSCYILADTFFISKGLGADGLTALNLAIPVYSFIHGTGLMLGMGGATKFSIFRAQKMDKSADGVFSNTIYLTVAAALLFVVLGLFCSEKITLLLRADAAVYEMTHTYLKVILLFAPAYLLDDVLVCFVRNDGNPKLAMLAMLIGSLCNIVLDYIFIFPLRMGIFGAVLATGFAPLISMLILSWHFLKKQNHFRLVRTKPGAAVMGTICSLGFPSLIAEVASGIVMIVFNMLMLRLIGNVGVAAYGVIANLALVVVSVYTGIAQGMQPLVSRAYGRGGGNGTEHTDERDNGKETEQILHYAMWTMLVFSAVVYLCIFLFANPIAAVFNSENNVQLQALAAEGLKLYFTAVPFIGFNMVLTMFFASMEKALPAQIISLLRGILLIIPMAFLLAALAGLTGVWLAVPITEGMVAVIGAVWYILWKRKRKLI